MVNVNFYNSVDDHLLKFAVIVAKSNGKWVFCKHKERNTYEIPGGHREFGEDIETTAKRELFEETGAIDYTLTPIGVYSVSESNHVRENDTETFGMLYYAEIKEFSKLPNFEMEKVCLFSDLPTQLTYPLIQPRLVEKVNTFLHHKLSLAQNLFTF